MDVSNDQFIDMHFVENFHTCGGTHNSVTHRTGLDGNEDMLKRFMLTFIHKI